MTAVTLVGTASAIADPASSTPQAVTLTTPAGVTAGDILIAVISAQGSDAVTTEPTVSSGTWTERARNTGAGRYGSILTKVATGSEPSTFTFTIPALSGSSRHEGILLAVRGAASIDGAAWNRGAVGTSISVPTQSGLTTGVSLVLSGMTMVTSSPNLGTTSPSPPTGHTAVGSCAQSPDGSASSNWSHAWARTATALSDTGPAGTVTGPTIADWKGWSLAANPAAPPTTTFVWDGTTEIPILATEIWDGNSAVATSGWSVV